MKVQTKLKILKFGGIKMSGGNAAVACNYFDGMTKLSKHHKRFMYIAAVAYFFDLMELIC